MPATKERDSLRTLAERRAAIAVRVEEKQSEIAEGERQLAEAKAARSSGGPAQAVAAAKGLVDTLKEELEPLLAELSAVDERIAAATAEREAQAQRRDVRRQAVENSGALVRAVEELTALRREGIRVLRAFIATHEEINRLQKELRGARMFLQREEGMTRDAAIAELRQVGVDVDGCNVVFSNSGRSTAFNDALQHRLVRFENEGAEGSAFDSAAKVLGFN